MRTFTKVLFAALAVLMVGIMPAKAHADAIGDTVNLKFYYPNGTTLYADYGNKTVSSGTEYQFFLNVDITANQIITTILQTGQFTPSGTFVGYYLNDLTKAFNSVSVDASTTTPALTGLSLNSSGIGVNFSGMNVVAGQKVVLNFTNAAAAVTPEPSSLVLLGTGLLGVVGAARRRFLTA